MAAELAFDLTVDDVARKIREIKLISLYDEDESSIQLGDLMEDILRAIADGAENPYDLAYTFFSELDKNIEDVEGNTE